MCPLPMYCPTCLAGSRARLSVAGCCRKYRILAEKNLLSFLFYTLLSGYFANKEEGRWFMAPLQSMNWFLSSIIAFASAIIASMGIGGGAVLLLFLTVFSDIPLATAQGTNLLFFLPVGAVALLFHKKSGLLQVKRGCLRPVGGLPGVFLGVWIASRLESTILSKLFALFCFIWA